MSTSAVAYGDDPFSYDFDATLVGTRSGPRKAQEPTEADERAFYAAIPVLRYGVDDFAFTGPGSLLGGSSVATPTAAQLSAHRERFEPNAYRGPSAEERRLRIKARAAHREACDEIAHLYNFTGEDIGRMVSELRREGHSVPEISERCGVPEGNVRMIVRGGQKRGSGARKTTARRA